MLIKYNQKIIIHRQNFHLVRLSKNYQTSLLNMKSPHKTNSSFHSSCNYLDESHCYQDNL